MELFAADGHDAGGCERVTGKSGMRPIPPGSRCVEHRSLQSTQQCRRSSTQPPGRFSCFGTPSTRCTWWIVAATILPGRSGTVVVSHTGRHRHPPLPPDARRRAQPRPQPGPQNPRPRRPAARRRAVGHLRRQRKAHRPSTGPTPPSPRWTRTSGPNWPSTSAPCNCCRRFRESISAAPTPSWSRSRRSAVTPSVCLCEGCFFIAMRPPVFPAEDADRSRCAQRIR